MSTIDEVENTVGYIKRLLDQANPGSGDSWQKECEMIEVANQCYCPQCEHKMAYHDGNRKCHAIGSPYWEATLLTCCKCSDSRLK